MPWQIVTRAKNILTDSNLEVSTSQQWLLGMGYPLMVHHTAFHISFNSASIHSRNRRAWRLYSPHSSAEQMEYAALLIGVRGVFDVLGDLNPPAQKIFIEGDCRHLAVWWECCDSHFTSRRRFCCNISHLGSLLLYIHEWLCRGSSTVCLQVFFELSQYTNSATQKPESQSSLSWQELRILSSFEDSSPTGTAALNQRRCCDMKLGCGFIVQCIFLFWCIFLNICCVGFGDILGNLGMIWQGIWSSMFCSNSLTWFCSAHHFTWLQLYH